MAKRYCTASFPRPFPCLCCPCRAAQGLHDVASVLLFVCGERAAYRMLAYLVTCHVRDCTRPSVDAAVEVLALLYPILQQVRSRWVCVWCVRVRSGLPG
jgi:hypothetical protein